MCGIAGVVSFDGEADERAVARMCAAMYHRGPDGEGHFSDDGVAIGMRRLAIIDLEHGDQPLYNEDRSVAVVLNGEIYNFLELRESFSAWSPPRHSLRHRGDRPPVRGTRRRTRPASPGNVRVRALGSPAIKARARPRPRREEAPVLRVHGRSIAFASELRALLRHSDISREVDPRAIDAYLALQYVPEPLAAVAGISKLPPASTLEMDEAGVRLERYWRLEYEPKTTETDHRVHAERALGAASADATRVRLISDVPVGAFLSGGLDSSAVVAAMTELHTGPVRTFSIAFDDPRYDESGYARAVSRHLGTVHEGCG